MSTSSEVIRLMIRVYRAGVLQSATRVGVPLAEMDTILPKLAEQHGQMMALQPGHIEIEFLDEPDVNKRFFRIGTDRSAMVNPYLVDLESPQDLEDVLKRWEGLK